METLPERNSVNQSLMQGYKLRRYKMFVKRVAIIPNNYYDRLSIHQYKKNEHIQSEIRDRTQRLKESLCKQSQARDCNPMAIHA